MKRKDMFFRTGILFLALLLFAALTGCNVLKPVTPDEIPEPTLAERVSHAEAWSIIFFPWPIKDGKFTEGPFKGYKIETDGETLSGYRIYVHSNNGYFRPEDIESFYERKLVQEWWPKEENWQRVDLNETRNLWVWKRGGQVFIVACGDAEYVKSFHTYLIRK